MNIAQNWRLNDQRYVLQCAQCEVCEQVTFPPREVCPKCAAEQHEHDLKKSKLTVLVMPEMAGEFELRRAGR